MSLETNDRIIDLAPDYRSVENDSLPYKIGERISIPDTKDKTTLTILLDRFCVTSWRWIATKLDLKRFPHDLNYSFPEFSDISMPELDKITKHVHFVATIKEITSGWQVSEYQISKRNSPAITLELVTTVETTKGNFRLSRLITCYAANHDFGYGQVVAGKVDVVMDEESQRALQAIHNLAYPSLREGEPDIGTVSFWQQFNQESVTVQENTEQIAVPTLKDFLEYKKQAENEISAMLKAQGIQQYIVEVRIEPRANTVLNRGQHHRSGEKDVVTIMQEFFVKKMPTSTWSMDSTEFYITRGIERVTESEITYTLPRYVFSVLLRIESGKKTMGTLTRDFDVQAVFDEEEQKWFVETSLIQTQKDMDSEIIPIRDLWNHKMRIGKKLEEGRLRHPYKGGLPGLKQ